MELTYTEAKELIRAIGRFEAMDFEHYGLTTLQGTNGAEYAIGTDDEADNAWNESLNSYLDECLYPEMPEFAQSYFNEEKWKSDAKHDGRGHSLSSYDGCETELDCGLFVYRIN